MSNLMLAFCMLLISTCCILNSIALSFDNCDDFNDRLIKRLNSTHHAVCGPNDKVTCYRRVESTYFVNEADAPVEKFDCKLYVETKDSVSERRNLGVFIQENSFEWPKGVLCYQVSNGFTQTERDHIQTAVSKLNAVSSQTGARVITRNQCRPDMGVCDQCRHYVNVRPGEGCHSFVGMVKMRNGRPQELSLENSRLRNCFGNGAGTALHEFGHALGLYHEHSHPKRAVVFLPENLQVSPRNYEIRDLNVARNTPYDKDSIMHYSLYSTWNRQAGLCIPKDPSIEYCGVKRTRTCVIASPKDCDLEAGKNIGQRQDLSKGDIQALRVIYKGLDGGISPRTKAPRTSAPRTRAPRTRAPRTTAPRTRAPRTRAPRTRAPRTGAPRTRAPRTSAPRTRAPRTRAPRTRAPRTRAPRTSAPRTSAPRTRAPRTRAPRTRAPRTRAPRTSAPRTRVPITRTPVSTNTPTRVPRTTAPALTPSLTNTPRTNTPTSTVVQTVAPLTKTEAPLVKKNCMRKNSTA